MHCSVCRKLILCLYLFQNNPIRGKTEAEDSSRVLLFVFIKSCCLLTSAAQNEAVLWNICVNELRPICKLWFWFVFLLHSVALLPRFTLFLTSCARCQEDFGPLDDPVDICLPATHVVGPDTSSQMGEGIPGGNSSAVRPWRERFGNCWQNLKCRSSTRTLLFWFSHKCVC